MVSTVITTAITASAGGIAVIGLIVLLVTRELADASEQPAIQLFSRHLAVFAMPLLVAFAFIVIMEVLRALA